jgi:hypothetical protein
MHRVGAGETLATIGKRYGVMPANIVAVNRLETAQAVEGDRLLIPSVQRAQAPPVVKRTITASAHRKGTTRGKPVTTASARPVHKSPVVVAHNNTN